MRATESFELLPDPAGRVRHRALPIEAAVPGTVLEAQLELGDAQGFLLLLSDDRPHGQVLHAVLLDPTGQELERLELGQPHVPGLFEGVEIVTPSVLRLWFFSGWIHELEVRPRPSELMPRRLWFRAWPNRD